MFKETGGQQELTIFKPPPAVGRSDHQPRRCVQGSTAFKVEIWPITINDSLALDRADAQKYRELRGPTNPFVDLARPQETIMTSISLLKKSSMVSIETLPAKSPHLLNKKKKKNITKMTSFNCSYVIS